MGGETGTGKELVARAIHDNSNRAKNPFIEVNCSAFQESLLESELFGYEAGAFTDAKQRKRGLFELAHGGTFFLDEIGDMSFELQAKLLKVIEEQKFRRMGGTKEVKVDTRIISATSRDLGQNIAIGKFREDLFYRLNVASIDLPPLRDRGEDIRLIAEHFIHLFNLEFNKEIKGLTPEVYSLFLRHRWPGNVRELRNVIERAVLFELGQYISSKHVHLHQSNEVYVNSGQTASLDPILSSDILEDGIPLSEMEITLLKKALDHANGNQTRAANILGISRETFKYRMKKYKLK